MIPWAQLHMGRHWLKCLINDVDRAGNALTETSNRSYGHQAIWQRAGIKRFQSPSSRYEGYFRIHPGHDDSQPPKNDVRKTHNT